MNSVPAHERGAASGIRGTVFNSGSSLSIGVFFSLMIVGLAGVLPETLTEGLTGQGVPGDGRRRRSATCRRWGRCSRRSWATTRSSRCSARPATLDTLPQHNVDVLTGKEFFPHLMSQPFHHGLVIVFLAAAVMSVVGAVASWAAGGKFVHQEAVGEALGRE